MLAVNVRCNSLDSGVAKSTIFFPPKRGGSGELLGRFSRGSILPTCTLHLHYLPLSHINKLEVLMAPEEHVIRNLRTMLSWLLSSCGMPPVLSTISLSFTCILSVSFTVIQSSYPLQRFRNVCAIPYTKIPLPCYRFPGLKHSSTPWKTHYKNIYFM